MKDTLIVIAVLLAVTVPTANGYWQKLQREKEIARIEAIYRADADARARQIEQLAELDARTKEAIHGLVDKDSVCFSADDTGRLRSLWD